MNILSTAIDSWVFYGWCLNAKRINWNDRFAPLGVEHEGVFSSMSECDVAIKLFVRCICWTVHIYAIEQTII